MNLKHITRDSLRFATSNWLKVVVLGMVIFIADMVNDLSFLGPVAQEVDFLLVAAGSILGIFEAGYIFRTIEESTHGNDHLPQFNRWADMFIHGVKELLITIIYFALPILILLIGVGLISQLIGSINENFAIFLVIFGLILASLIYIPYQAAILNMARYHGSLRSGFEVRKIIYLMWRIGFKKLAFVYMITVILAIVVLYTLKDTLTVLPFHLGDAVSGLILAPFILIFTARALGLINRGLI